MPLKISFFLVVDISYPDTNSEFRVSSVNLYNINNNLELIDSISILDYTFKSAIGTFNSNYLSVKDNELYIHYPLYTEDDIVRDTLYKIQDNELIPDLRLKFTDRQSIISKETRKYIHSINRSSRYIFIKYFYQYPGNSRYSCYDTKTRKYYHMKTGYSDDIHTGEKVDVRLLQSEQDKFYYFHANKKDPNANPTLYIGTLKK